MTYTTSSNQGQNMQNPNDFIRDFLGEDSDIREYWDYVKLMEYYELVWV